VQGCAGAWIAVGSVAFLNSTQIPRDRLDVAIGLNPALRCGASGAGESVPVGFPTGHARCPVGLR